MMKLFLIGITTVLNLSSAVWIGERLASQLERNESLLVLVGKGFAATGNMTNISVELARKAVEVMKVRLCTSRDVVHTRKQRECQACSTCSSAREHLHGALATASPFSI